MLTKDAIRAASDLPREMVQVPEWGGFLYVRTMTGTERDAWETGLSKGKHVNLDKVRAKLAVAVACDADGKPMFDASDVDWLSEKSAAALQRIFAAASKLNCLSSSDVEELAKN